MHEPDARIDRMAPRQSDPPAEDRRNSVRTLLRNAEGLMTWAGDGDGGDVTCRVNVLNISGAGAATLADRAPRVGHTVQLQLPSKPVRAEPIEGDVIETRPDPSGRWVVHMRFTRWIPLGPFLEANRERRVWERHAVRESGASVSWLEGTTENALQGSLLNISVGGAAFLSNGLPPQGVSVWLRLDAAIRQGVPIDAVEGRVVMTSFDPAGGRVAHIHFVDLCPPDFFYLAVNGGE
jgi:hypothetical protein